MELVVYILQLGSLMSQVMPMVETTPIFSMAASVSGSINNFFWTSYAIFL
jgi:hypothetical protein